VIFSEAMATLFAKMPTSAASVGELSVLCGWGQEKTRATLWHLSCAGLASFTSKHARRWKISANGKRARALILLHGRQKL